MGRHSLFGVAVLAATGVPYALTSVTGERPQESAFTADAQDVAGGPSHAFAGAADGALAVTPLPQAPPLEGPQVADLAEVLRFDVAPSWLLERWPRVMNCPNDQNLQAYRVLLVTGADETDLAGALTYYFTAEQKLQRIQFQGTSGDTRPLVRHLTTHFNLAPVRSHQPGEQLYQVQRNGRAVSQLRIVTSSIVDASSPTTRFHVELVLERPSEHRWFSEARPIVDRMRWP